MNTDHITWSDLELFLAIDRGGSLSGAGRLLKVKQSTISRRLTELEQRLGEPLFVRSQRGVLPTPLGVSWRVGAERAEQGVLEARRATMERMDGIRGRVRIASLLSVADLFLAPALPALLEKHPGLQIDLQASSAVSDLSRLEADIAVRLFRPQTGDLIAKAVASGELVAHGTHTIARRVQGQPVAKWPWLGWSSPKYMHPVEASWMKAQGITPHVTFLSPTTQLSAALSGVGVALLGKGIHYFHPTLEPIPVPSMPKIVYTWWLVVHRELRHVPRIDAVWRWLLETLQITPE